VTEGKPKVRLHHFEHHAFGAPGEPVRLALAVGGFEFEDLRVPRQGDAWPRLRGTGLCPFRQLPVLEVGDVVVSQSNAVLRYAGLLTGLYPVEDPLRAGKVDEVLGVIQDVKVRMMPSLIEQEPGKKARMRNILARERLPWWFGRLEASLVANDDFFKADRGFCVGDRLTVADLALACFLGWFAAGAFLGIHATLLDGYPRLRAVLESVASVPQIFRWREEHPTKYFHESDWIPALQGLRRAMNLLEDEKLDS